MPATTPTLTLCDKLVELMTAAWLPFGDDSVERVYQMPLEVKKLKGRKVYVFPNTYGSEPATRAEDQYTHDLIVLTVRRFEDATKPPVEWIDTEVDFVTDYVFEGLDFSHSEEFAGRGPLKWNGRTVTTAGSGPVQVCDFDRLDKLNVFWCEVPFSFSEIR